MTEAGSIIAVGDTLVHDVNDLTSVVTSVEIGQYGIFVQSDCRGTNTLRYFPCELPPVGGKVYDFYGWAFRSQMTLLNEVVLGYVNFDTYDSRVGNIAEYDKEWERTIEAIRKEEMPAGCVPVDPARMRG